MASEAHVIAAARRREQLRANSRVATGEHGMHCDVGDELQVLAHRFRSTVMFDLRLAASRTSRLCWLLLVTLELALALVGAQLQGGRQMGGLQTTSPQGQTAQYQLVGQAGGLVRLPCLVGLPSVCGLPYFIAWYKHNAREDSWTRFEYRESSELSSESDQIHNQNNQVSGPSRALSERVEFFKPNEHTSSSSPLCSNSAKFNNQLASGSNQFGCAQLTIRKLELLDEGQYKCEITFSESIEVDKCPPYTISQLSVTGKLNVEVPVGVWPRGRQHRMVAKMQYLLVIQLEAMTWSDVVLFAICARGSLSVSVCVLIIYSRLASQPS